MNSIAHRADSASTVPAVDLTPTGHALPFLADDSAREHTEPLLTPEQSTLVLDDGLAALVTAPVETELRDVDCAGELTPAQAREALDAMRDFLPRLEAVVAFAEQEAAGDFEGDPEIARLDREAEARRIRAITEGRA